MTKATASQRFRAIGATAADLAHNLARLLDGHGWRVTAAADVRSALHAMSGDRADRECRLS